MWIHLEAGETLEQLHNDGRELVAGIIKRKQEAEAWKLWEQANPSLGRRRPRTQWPDEVSSAIARSFSESRDSPRFPTPPFARAD